MHMTRTLVLILSSIAFTGGAAPPAMSDSYPVSGLWTYQNASEKGPAQTCDSPTMEFRGNRRFDFLAQECLFNAMQRAGFGNAGAGPT